MKINNKNIAERMQPFAVPPSWNPESSVNFAKI